MRGLTVVCQTDGGLKESLVEAIFQAYTLHSRYLALSCSNSKLMTHGFRFKCFFFLFFWLFARFSATVIIACALACEMFQLRLDLVAPHV